MGELREFRFKPRVKEISQSPIKVNSLDGPCDSKWRFYDNCMEEIRILNEERIEPQSPEAELWRAVMEQAIDDLSDPDLGEAAVKWFTSVSEEPSTFRWVCEHLNLDASAVWFALAQRNDRKSPAKLVA